MGKLIFASNVWEPRHPLWLRWIHFFLNNVSLQVAFDHIYIARRPAWDSSFSTLLGHLVQVWHVFLKVAQQVVNWKLKILVVFFTKKMQWCQLLAIWASHKKLSKMQCLFFAYLAAKASFLWKYSFQRRKNVWSKVHGRGQGGEMPRGAKAWTNRGSVQMVISASFPSCYPAATLRRAARSVGRARCSRPRGGCCAPATPPFGAPLHARCRRGAGHNTRMAMYLTCSGLTDSLSFFFKKNFTLFAVECVQWSGALV